MDGIFLSACVPIYSTAVFRPMGPYQLAWYLRQHNYKIQVIDFIHYFTEDETLALIDKFVTPNTKVVGIGFMIGLENPDMGALIKKFENILFKVKKKYPWVKIVIGNSTAHIWARMQRNRTLFDYVFTGFAENTALALFNHLYRNGPMPPFELVEGNIFIREKFSMPVETNFDITQCRHAWHDRDLVQEHETLPLELSRGCIFKCAFCRYPYIGRDKDDFTRDMECVKQELLENYRKWKVTNYYMLDDTFNADQQRLKKFHEMVQTLPFKIKYSTYIRADLVHAHPESAKLLLESGLTACYLGIESLHKEASALIGKAWNGKHAREFIPKLIKDLWEDKVQVHLGLICGIPPETLESCKETNKWALNESAASGISWHWLHMQRDAHAEYRSEFDINAEKYGFTWIVENGKPVWKTDYCTETIAKEWRDELYAEVIPKQKLLCWHLFELGNYFEDIEVARNKKVSELPWKEIKSLRSNWLKNYYQQLSDLPDQE